MMRTMVAALLVSAGLAGLVSCAEVGASVSQGRIDRLRLGFGLNPEGRVSPGCVAKTFGLRDPIHLSMRVSDAPPGSFVRVAVRDTGTERIAWIEERPVPAGRSYLTFAIGRGLGGGRYRVDSTLGSNAVSSPDFVVHDRSRGARTR